MKDEFKQLKKDFEKGLKDVSDIFGLEELEQQFFGRKSGLLSGLMKGLKNMENDVKKEFGVIANGLKDELMGLLDMKKEELEKDRINKLAKSESIDVTQSLLKEKKKGHVHPISQIQKITEDFFSSMGFLIGDGPELESDYFNFTAVNVPENHPARDMQDTFYIKGKSDLVMRTHTSSVQVRAMLEHGAPLRMIIPGRCFRNEATDLRHEHTFFQVEGVVVDKGINFSHMKGVLEAFGKHLYGEKTKIRLRPKFYPFVEPGVNGEVTCYLCKGQGCKVCKKTGWLEIFGAGMVHPNVLKQGGIDPNVYSGFAFGFGLNRLVMLRYGIEDGRLFNSGDLRFLQQF